MKVLFALSLIIFSFGAYASSYIGGNYGYSSFTSPEVKEYKGNQKGPTYGGFIGVGKDFVGLEGFYQVFNTTGKIKHDGESYDFNSTASGMGAALRFSFDFFYLRLGVGRYNLKQKLDIDDSSIRNAADKIYNVQNGVSKNGVLLGIGLHKRLGNSFVSFIDYTRNQVTGIGSYDALSVGLSFNIPEKLFSLGKF